MTNLEIIGFGIGLGICVAVASWAFSTLFNYIYRRISRRNHEE